LDDQFFKDTNNRHGFARMYNKVYDPEIDLEAFQVMRRLFAKLAYRDKANLANSRDA
jgi:hypothetical protein